MWDTWNTPWETVDAEGKHGSHGFRNFEVAAGTVKGFKPFVHVAVVEWGTMVFAFDSASGHFEIAETV